jgi:hypothetical protein
VTTVISLHTLFIKRTRLAEVSRISTARRTFAREESHRADEADEADETDEAARRAGGFGGR